MADAQYVTDKARIVSDYVHDAGDDNELRSILHERVPQYLGEVLDGNGSTGLPPDTADALTALRALVPNVTEVWLLPAPMLHEVREVIERLALTGTRM